MMRWAGAVLIVAASAAIGFLMGAEQRRELRELRQLSRGLNYMSCELRYSLPPLTELCIGAARECTGQMKTLFEAFSMELSRQVLPDAAACMGSVLAEIPFPPLTAQSLQRLGESLGHFDLEGQLQGIEEVRTLVKGQLEDMERHHDTRIRNYQTLSICAGAALAILLI